MTTNTKPTPTHQPRATFTLSIGPCSLRFPWQKPQTYRFRLMRTVEERPGQWVGKTLASAESGSLITIGIRAAAAVREWVEGNRDFDGVTVTPEDRARMEELQKTSQTKGN